MPWLSRKKPEAPAPVAAPSPAPEVVVHVRGVSEAMQSTVDALVAAFRSEIAARDATIAAQKTEVDALRAEVKATVEHLGHITTRFNSLQGLVNRKLTTGKSADPDEMPQTFAPWPPLGAR